MADSTIELPPGYEDEAAFLLEMRQKFSQAESADRENRDAAREDLEFVANINLWDPGVRAARIAQGRPCLEINQLPQFIAQVVGDIRINRPAIKVRPVEDGDVDVAEIRQGLIRSIEQQSNAAMAYAEAGTHQVACGMGYFRLGLEYAGDDSFDRDITIKSIPNPLSVRLDPYAVEPTGKDARYLFIDDDIPRKDYEKQYGDISPALMGDDSSDGEGWFNRDSVRVCEYWIMKETPVELAQLADGSVVSANEVPKSVKPQTTRTSVKRTACMYLVTGTKILSGPHEFPISRLPVFRARGWEMPVGGTKRVRWGLVRYAKDAVRLKCYWRSISAELLAMAPKAQWSAANATVEGREDDFRNAHRSGDPLLIHNDNTPPPVRVDPAPIPTAVLQEAELNAQDIKDVTGLHDASLGAKSNETSGVAINARDRQGDVATYIYPDNLKEAICECGRTINELIPVVYDTARTVRVLGEDETAKVQRINDPNHPDSKPIDVGKYDVVIETGPSYSTKRVEAAASMIEFFRADPQAMALAGDLVARAQDWPMAAQIAERLKKALPPGVAEDDRDPSKPPSPEDQQKAAAEQHAMEVKGQMDAMDLALKDATVRKLRAEAAKAETDAEAALFQLGVSNGDMQQQMLHHAVETLFGPQGDPSQGQPDQSGAPAQDFGQGMPPPDQPATAAVPA